MGSTIFCVYILASRSRTLYTGVTNEKRQRESNSRFLAALGMTVTIEHASDRADAPKFSYEQISA